MREAASPSQQDVAFRRMSEEGVERDRVDVRMPGVTLVDVKAEEASCHAV
jgi:hypothetical protein